MLCREERGAGEAILMQARNQGEEKGEGRKKKQERQRKMRGRVINELKHSYGGKVVGEGGGGE